MTPRLEAVMNELAESTAEENCGGGDDYDAKMLRRGFRAGFVAAIAEAEVLVEHLELDLSFAPKGPVPEGLAGMFYGTLDYKEEVKLHERIDAARAALAKWNGGET
jgi:hypothetical protein